ncbi:metal-dependent hydrolase [Bryobacterales bacterium F-183]|nr:metal-dependent hydrolase [Bryobacterales bacterium F-183]
MAAIDITWLGHSAFELKLDTGEVFLLDPWLGNPKYPASKQIERCDYILLSHGHFDHTGGVAELSAKYNNAPVVAIYEIATYLQSKQNVKTIGMNKGGSTQLGPVTVTMTHAIHSSSMSDEQGNIIYAGEAAGYVLTFADGRALYFAGDTAVFSDMALIAEIYQPELCILPIGDFYTMGPREAAVACRLLKAKKVIGMHWGTFDALPGTPAKLAELAPAGTEVISLEPGAAYRW